MPAGAELTFRHGTAFDGRDFRPARSAEPLWAAHEPHRRARDLPAEFQEDG